MSWRFRQSFKVIPGLRLNLSRSGLSASIGGAPFTINVGPHGVMGTTSIPGTGVSYRHHFGATPQTHEVPFAPLAPQPGTVDQGFTPATPNGTPQFPIPHAFPPTTSSAPIEEVRSASTELLTSESLKELKRLMQTTYEEREDIGNQLGDGRREQYQAKARYESWENGLLFKRVFKSAFAKRKAAADTANAKVAELEEQLRLTTVATQVGLFSIILAVQGLWSREWRQPAE